MLIPEEVFSLFRKIQAAGTFDVKIKILLDENGERINIIVYKDGMTFDIYEDGDVVMFLENFLHEDS